MNCIAASEAWRCVVQYTRGTDVQNAGVINVVVWRTVHEGGEGGGQERGQGWGQGGHLLSIS
eukprot:6545670-Pyramimonas_sp.AAC.1